MLVVTRKPGEEIVVPEVGLTFTILEVRPGKVRVGITAPGNLTIHRREVWERIQGWSESQAVPAPGEGHPGSAVPRNDSHPA